MIVQAPSGRQVELRHGEQRAVIVENGGGLRSYTAGGRAVLDGYPESELASAGRGQVLFPWPNRLAGGRWETTVRRASSHCPKQRRVTRSTAWCAGRHGMCSRQARRPRPRTTPSCPNRGTPSGSPAVSTTG